MKVSRQFIIGFFIIITLFLVACGEESSIANKTKPIIFADEGWDSIRFHNEVAGIIIEEGFGYETEQITGSDVALWKGLEQGDIDIHMEGWTENLKEIYTQAIDSGKVIEVSVNFDDNYQGLYVPTYVIEGDPERGIEPVAPDLKYITDLVDYADVFVDPDDPQKGRIVGATPGWAINDIFEAAIEDYGLDEYYNYMSPGSESAINASLVKAYDAGEPWLGYNYEPNWIMGMYDMTPLLEEDPDGVIAEVASQDITIAVNIDLKEEAPEVVEFLEKYETTSQIASDALTYIQEEEASAYEAAVNFLQVHEDIWTKWVPEDVVEKVKDSLNK